MKLEMSAFDEYNSFDRTYTVLDLKLGDDLGLGLRTKDRALSWVQDYGGCKP